MVIFFFSINLRKPEHVIKGKRVAMDNILQHIEKCVFQLSLNAIFIYFLLQLNILEQEE